MVIFSARDSLMPSGRRLHSDAWISMARPSRSELRRNNSCNSPPSTSSPNSPHTSPIAKACPHSARAPPQITFGRYQQPANGIVYGKVGDEAAETTDNNAQFNQSPPGVWQLMPSMARRPSQNHTKIPRATIPNSENRRFTIKVYKTTNMSLQ